MTNGQNEIERPPADTVESLLRECLGLMEAVVEPCDHSVGSCWCEWHRVMDRAYAILPTVQS